MNWSLSAACLLAVCALTLQVGQAHSTRNVTFDSRSLLIDGERKLFISGSVHYPRSSVGEWKGIIQAAKEAGVDIIETYTFWNMHEAKKGEYDFSDNYNLIAFLNEVQDAGLYAIVRLGPYICGEVTYGGLPVWLREDEGIQFRLDNPQWESEVESWVRHVITIMKAEGVFYTQGGPVILTQIENEYGTFEGGDGQAGKRYVEWNGQLARALDVPVPWIMCAQDDAPDDIISTCNGFYCDGWIEGHAQAHPNQPALFTENWPGWFQRWGDAKPTRPIEDIAYSVAKWFAAGGSLNNYYMLQGGTNFGRTAAAFLVTSYDYNVIIDEYGVPRQPDYNHLQAMHQVLHAEADIILGNPRALPQRVGNTQVVSYTYGELNGRCVAFLTNSENNDISVVFNGLSFTIPGWSITILSDGCTREAYNTAKVPADTVIQSEKVVVEGLEWLSYEEPLIWTPAVPLNGSSSFPLEQIELTKDTSDFLTYVTTVHNYIPTTVTLTVDQVVDTNIHVLVNGVVVGSTFFGGSNIKVDVDLKQGDNEIALVCGMMGLANFMARIETYTTGIHGNIRLGGTVIPHNQWKYIVGLQGESLQLHSLAGSASVQWFSLDQTQDVPSNPTAHWFKSSTFDAPSFTFPLAVEVGGLNKGSLWVNGRHLGRYWNIAGHHVSACDTCSYKGGYDPDSKCRVNCGEPSQRLYHVPRDWLQPEGNFFVVHEELQGTPANVRIVQLVTQSLAVKELVTL